MSLQDIKDAVDRFIAFAMNRPELRFKLTPVGCGLAGYQPGQIAPMFATIPSNCQLPDEFKTVLENAD